MKKNMIRVAVIAVVLAASGALVCRALSNNFRLDVAELPVIEGGKEQNVRGNFKAEYNLAYKVAEDDEELKKEIESLTKKTTYLLFGDFGAEESSENFYKRKKEWYALRYAPEIPKDENGLFGLDATSQEYKDDLVSGMAIPQIFSQANELGLKYSSYGDIRVTLGNGMAMSTIVLPKVKAKVQSKTDPMKYEYKETDFVMHYYYKKLGDEWKLYYVYGEGTDDVAEYFDEVGMEGTKGIMAVAPMYESKLGTVYSFEKANNLSQDELNKIYSENARKVVFLESYYNNSVMETANGFYISDGLVVTAWNFVEKSLTEAQYITVRNDRLENIAIEGIVTVNPETDIAVLKVAPSEGLSVKLGNAAESGVEDAAIVLSSKVGTGMAIQTGIIIANGGYIQTSIPLAESDEGSPLFNQQGEVIGMNTAKSTNLSVSVAVGAQALGEVQEKFGKMRQAEIEAVPFSRLKEDYYTKYDSEVTSNNIPEKVWKKYAEIGRLDETIKMELVKASYKDNIVSLRYRNKIAQFVSSMQMAGDFREELEREGYKEVAASETKIVYENGEYRVILMDEFGCLIIVMVRK